MAATTRGTDKRLLHVPQSLRGQRIATWKCLNSCSDDSVHWFTRLVCLSETVRFGCCWIDTIQQSDVFWRRQFVSNEFNAINFNRIKCYLIPFDSSLNALWTIFWVQLDWTKRSAGNGRNNTRYRQETLTPAAHFRDFAAELFAHCSRTHKQSCRAFKGLSTDVQQHRNVTKISLVKRQKLSANSKKCHSFRQIKLIFS
jgi:hypothetical protein